MLRLGCTYLKVKDMKKSIVFYTALLEIEPTFSNKDRWVMFHCGNCLALYNNQYDLDIINNNSELNKHYNEEYLNYVKNETSNGDKNFVLNFDVENLNYEYDRIKKLDIGQVSKIMYVNITMPYYFFIVVDPDGNEIEITGEYTIDTCIS